MTTIDFTPITEAQWLTLDDFAIARIIGCCSHTVRRERERLGYPKVRKPGSGRPRKAGPYDPTLSTKENAKRMGVTIQRVNQIKKEATAKQEEDWV